MASILIVDDLISIHEMLAAVIHPTGYATAFATDGEKALARYKTEKFDLVLADIDMKPMDGLTLLKQLKQYDPGVVVIIMTAYASTDSAIQALKFGAFEYLQKPFRVDELMQTLKSGLEFRRVSLEREASLGAPSAGRAGDFEARFPGESAKIKRLITQLQKLAATHTPVLLSGELGSGHEIAAELLHTAGSAPNSPLVRLDCRLSSEQSLRDSLLGPNGAGGTAVQAARGGTLLLQNVQCLPQFAQMELVTVLRNNSAQFRLICATEEDLEKLTEEGKFHEELFYRIAALPVQLPSLRERAGDIPALLRSFFTVRGTNPQFDARQIEFSEGALATLRAHRWPGNLAEFTQVISQVISTTDTRVITSAQLPLRVHELKTWPALADFLSDQKKQYIARVLQACGGDRVKAAQILGIDILCLD